MSASERSRIVLTLPLPDSVISKADRAHLLGIFWHQDLTLEAVGISTTTKVGSPEIASTHILSSEGLTVSISVSAPVLGQKHSLVAGGVTTGLVLEEPDVGQSHTLISVGIELGLLTEAPSIGQEHALSPNGLGVTVKTGRPHPSLVFELSASDIYVSIIAESTTFGQKHDLSVENDTIIQTVVSGPVLSLGDSLIAVGSAISLNLGSPIPTQTHNFIPAITEIIIVLSDSEIRQTHSLIDGEIGVPSIVGSPEIEQLQALFAIGLNIQPRLTSPVAVTIPFGALAVLFVARRFESNIEARRMSILFETFQQE